MNKCTENLIRDTQDWIRLAADPTCEFPDHAAVLLSWGLAAFPVVYISQEMADGFAATEPPKEPDGTVPFSGIAVEVAQRTTLILSTHKSEASFDHFKEKGVPGHLLARIPPEGMMAAFGNDLGFDEGAAHRIVDNVMYVLGEHRAKSDFDGVAIVERTPSAKANRKRGRKYYPGVEFVIGSTHSTGQGRGPASGSTRTGWEMSVRTRVNGFWRRQAWGPRHTLRKIIWVKPFMRGPVDAPLSIHTLDLSSRGEASAGKP